MVFHSFVKVFEFNLHQTPRFFHVDRVRYESFIKIGKYAEGISNLSNVTWKQGGWEVDCESFNALTQQKRKSREMWRICDKGMNSLWRIKNVATRCEWRFWRAVKGTPISSYISRVEPGRGKWGWKLERLYWIFATPKHRPHFILITFILLSWDTCSGVGVWYIKIIYGYSLCQAKGDKISKILSTLQAQGCEWGDKELINAHQSS